MTREEAISLLSQVNHILVNSNSWLENTHEPLNIAFNMAIKALEQEPFINKSCVSSGVCEHDKNKVLDKIRAEITAIAINGQVDEHTMFIRAGGEVKQMALDIIDKYKAEIEPQADKEHEDGCN